MMGIDRDAYKQATARLDAAWKALEAANKPLRDEYEDSCTALESVLDGADLVGKCLSCDEPVFEGEEHQQHGDGIVSCPDCAATLSETISSWRHEITSDPVDGWSWNDFVGSKEEYMALLIRMERDLAENGDRKILTT